MKAIYPTHTCFDDALDLMVEILKCHPDAANTDEFLIVHGICAPAAHDKFSHGWVETDHGKGVALFFVLLDGNRRMIAENVAQYYKLMAVQETTKYTPKQAWEQNYRYEHYGPWKEEYAKLCRNYKKSIECPKCGMVSYNPNDIKEKYCGNCHQFHVFLTHKA